MQYNSKPPKKTKNFFKLEYDEIFQPKPGRARESRMNGAPVSFMKQVRILSSKAGSSGRKSGSDFGRGTVPRDARRYDQRVVIKSRVVRTRGKDLKATIEHVRYLQREGVGADGREPEAFNSDGELSRQEAQTLVQGWEADRHHFRFIISPEKGNELDLQQYARSVVKQMEWDLRTRLEWMGVTHHNTDNPHIHILLRGVDERGADLVISRHYISRGARANAERIATRELGYRTERDIERSVQESLISNRLTGTDIDLLNTSQEHAQGLVDLTKATPAGDRRAMLDRQNKIRRLEYLESLGLASEVRVGLWKLEDRLLPRLRMMGIRNDAIKLMHMRMRRIDPAADLVVVDKDNPPEREIVGRVLHKGLADELYDKKYLIVGDDHGKAYYVPLSRESEIGKSCDVQDTVRIAGKSRDWTCKADFNIAEFCARHRGVYDAKRHGEEMQSKLPKHVSPEAYVGNHTKRLGTLKRMGLAEELSPGCWRVDEQLIDKLKAQTVGWLAVEVLGQERPLGLELKRELE